MNASRREEGERCCEPGAAGAAGPGDPLRGDAEGERQRTGGLGAGR